jgi:hypothetical protein
MRTQRRRDRDGFCRSAVGVILRCDSREQATRPGRLRVTPIARLDPMPRDKWCDARTAVIHFEVIGANPQRLRNSYGELFGWPFDTPYPVASEVSDPDSYGFVDLITTTDGSGTRGGIGGGPNLASHTRLLCRRSQRRGRVAPSRGAGWHQTAGADHVAERAPRRPAHRPRSQPHRHRGRRLTPWATAL